MYPRELQRTVRLYYGFQLFFSLLVWLPIFYEFQKQIGLSDTQIFRIQSIYYIVFCFFELPTGALADQWGYRRSLVLGSVVLAAANLLPIVQPTYGGMLSHFLLIALARSFISGASSAYLYEQMAHFGHAPDYKIVEGKARAYGLWSKVVCWSFVGYLMQWQLTAPYWVTFVFSLLAVGFAVMLPNLFAPRQFTSVGLAQIHHPFVRLWTVFSSSPLIIFLVLQGVAIFVLGRVAQVNLFQPILVSKSFSLSTFGWIMSLMTIFEAIGSAYPHFFRKLMDDWHAVFALTAAMAVTLALIPLSGQIATGTMLCLFSLAMGFSFPIQRQLLNDAILDSKNRATVLSAESIVDRAVCAVVAASLGAFLEQNRLNEFLLLSAGITAVSMAILFIGAKLYRKAAFGGAS